MLIRRLEAGEIAPPASFGNVNVGKSFAACRPPATVGVPQGAVQLVQVRKALRSFQPTRRKVFRDWTARVARAREQEGVADCWLRNLTHIESTPLAAIMESTPGPANRSATAP